nr:unnamed protein product [Callosobruchus chinensis]
MEPLNSEMRESILWWLQQDEE